ncbi:hypothetical protein TcCL_ESM09328 [Trypanosoma cruzi]|nr:hypothetical protein TcCL_ESM09328 [Trypanosoma cruzi]
MFCWVLKQRGIQSYACVEFFLPCELWAAPRGCHFDSAELLCLFAGLAEKFCATSYCCCVLKCCHSMRSNVLQRVRVLIGFVCTLIPFATLCGHAKPEGRGNGAGRCLAASRPSFTARWCGAHCGVDSAV